MLPYINLKEIAIGPFKIHIWGLMFAIAFIVATLLGLREAKKTKGINEEHLLNIVLLMLIGAIFGSRFFYVLPNFNYFIKHPFEIVKFWHGGLVLYGGVVFSILFTYAYIKIKKLNFWRYANFVAPYIALGIFFGRIGCFFNGCCFGKPTNLPIGVVFPTAPDNLPRHPTQLYESIFGLVLFFILMSKRLRKLDKEFLCLLLSYSAFRFLIEFIRYYQKNFYYGPLTFSQYISIIIFVASCFYLKKFINQ